MKIRKIFITTLMFLILSFAAFSVTAFAAEGDADPNAFIPGGTGTVIDNVVEQNGKEFYTIKSEDGNIFYLIVDRLRDADNVYFLNAVTEADLMALAEKGGKTLTPNGNASENPGEEKPEQQQGQEKPKPASAGLDGNTTTMIFVGIAVVAVGGIGFYFKIVKSKKNKKDDDDFDEYEDEDDNDSDDDSDDETDDD